MREEHRLRVFENRHEVTVEWKDYITKSFIILSHQVLFG